MCMLGLFARIKKHDAEATVVHSFPRMNFAFDEACLTIVPEAWMTWANVHMLSEVLRSWAIHWDLIALDFDVYILDGRHLGSGAWIKLEDPDEGSDAE